MMLHTNRTHAKETSYRNFRVMISRWCSFAEQECKKYFQIIKNIIYLFQFYFLYPRIGEYLLKVVSNTFFLPKVTPDCH